MTPTAPNRPVRAMLAVKPSDHAPDEFVPLLECSYGSYVYQPNPQTVELPLNCPACHNPVERPEDRHHCSDCGGDYCSVHADPTAHDCARLTD